MAVVLVGIRNEDALSFTARVGVTRSGKINVSSQIQCGILPKQAQYMDVSLPLVTSDVALSTHTARPRLPLRPLLTYSLRPLFGAGVANFRVSLRSTDKRQHMQQLSRSTR